MVNAIDKGCQYRVERAILYLEPYLIGPLQEAVKGLTMFLFDIKKIYHGSLCILNF